MTGGAQLGSGGFGVTWKGSVKSTGQSVAVKQISKSAMRKRCDVGRLDPILACTLLEMPGTERGTRFRIMLTVLSKIVLHLEFSKFVRISCFQTEFFMTFYRMCRGDDPDLLKKEVEFMKKLSGHDNIVELIGAYEDADHVYIVMELASGGELFQRIVRK